jgi:hypothetical protein
MGGSSALSAVDTAPASDLSRFAGRLNGAAIPWTRPAS